MVKVPYQLSQLYSPSLYGYIDALLALYQNFTDLL